MAKRKKLSARKPLTDVFSSMALNATNSIAFHQAVVASSIVVQVKYTLSTTPGLTVSRIAFGFDDMNLTNDQDPADQDVFKTRGRSSDPILCFDRKLMVEVSADGSDGNGWSLTVTVNGKALTDAPIEMTVADSGNANYAELHQIP